MDILQTIASLLSTTMLCLSVFFIALYVKRAFKRIPEQLERTNNTVRQARREFNIAYLYILQQELTTMIREERYEEAAELKAFIDKTIKEVYKDRQKK